MTAWYYSDIQRNRLGPVAASDLEMLHNNGQLAPEILVWREGMPDWKPWREVMAEVLGGPVATPARATFAIARDDTPGGGNPYEVVERVRPASPYAAPSAAVGYGHAPVVTDGEVVYAGFWKRAAAFVIDNFIVGVAGFVVQMVVAGVMFGGMAALSGNPSDMFATGAGLVGVFAMYLAPLALGAAYFAFFHASGHQATPGKMAVGIKVTDDYGGHISFVRGIGRYFAQILSSLILCIGYVMAGFTDRRRALHDMVCNTLVVDRWAFTAHPERQRHELGAVTVVILCLGALVVVGYLLLIGLFVAALGAGMGR